MADDSIEDAIEQAAIDGIRKASGDQGSVEKMDIDQLIKADQYINSKKAAKAGGFGGLRFVQIVPPGADND